MGPPDEILHSLILDGDKDAYNTLVKRYFGKIWRLAISILKNEEEAEDAVQDVFLSLWQSLHSWDPDGTAKLSTWIYRVSFNKCIDIKRKRKPSQTSDGIDVVCENETAYQNTLQKELSNKITNLLTDLPKMQRMALKLYYYEELSIHEMCGRMARSEQSVRSLLKRARAGLKDKMEHDDAFQSFDVKSLSKQLWR